IPQPLFKQFLAQLLEKKQIKYGMEPANAKEFAAKNLENILNDLLDQGYIKLNATHYDIDALFTHGSLKMFGVPKAFPKYLLE
ncbi:MAG TPA: hypothetical protein VFP93_02395, partial [Gammaproteobacteria bacterium]|nr:hypothetical protein [Gammaproteobacteria bacterium]